ncbi:hypothetical protein D3C87_1841060 [compost metagenome]
MGEELAVAGFVIWQTQPAGQLVRHFGQRRFHLCQLARLEELIRYAGIFQHGNIARGVFVLLRGAEQLQRAALTPFVLNSR